MHYRLSLAAWLVLVGCSGSGTNPGDTGVQDTGEVTDTGSLTDTGGGTDTGGVTDTGDTAPADVRIVRDDFGVPHIEADTFEAAMYGLGRTMAEDRLFQMEVRRLRASGRLSEFFAVPNPVTSDDQDLNERLLNLDVSYRSMAYLYTAQLSVESLPADQRGLLEAFVAGINEQISERTDLGPAFEAAGITEVAPWTPADALGTWEVMADLFANPLAYARAEISNLLDCEDGACSAPSCGLSVIDEDAAVVSEPADGTWPPSSGRSIAGKTAFLRQLDPAIDLKASHGMVLAADRMSTASPFIWGEPQLFLEAPSTWYEHHIIVESEGINVRGIGFAGTPAMLLFFSNHHAQTLTAGSGDTADLFEITENQGGQTYLVDGRPETWDIIDDPILVRGADPVPHEVRVTRYGPIVTDLLDNAPAGRQFAMRRAEAYALDEHSVFAALDAQRATSLAEYRAALSGWSSPTVNALYAGVDGETGESHIAYHALTRIAQRAPQQIGDADLTGQHPLDGNDSANDWSGFYSLDWNPHVIDPASGVLFSGNHLPVGSWYSGVVYGGFRGNGDTLRSMEVRLRVEEFDARGTTISPEEAHAMHVDARSEVVKTVTAVLQLIADRGGIPADEAGNTPSTDAEKAARTLTALQRWETEGGALMDQRSVAFPLAGAIQGRLITNARLEPFACTWGGAEGGAAYFLKAFREDASVLGIVEANTIITVAAEALDVVSPDLGVDVSQWAGLAERDVEPWQAPYHRDFLCLQPGQEGQCSFDPSKDVPVAAAQSALHSITSARGSSWPFSVDFSDNGGQWALLAPGIHERPDNVHFDDRVPAIVTKGLGDIQGIPASALDLAEVSVSSEESFTWGP